MIQRISLIPTSRPHPYPMQSPRTFDRLRRTPKNSQVWRLHPRPSRTKRRQDEDFRFTERDTGGKRRRRHDGRTFPKLWDLTVSLKGPVYLHMQRKNVNHMSHITASSPVRPAQISHFMYQCRFFWLTGNYERIGKIIDKLGLIITAWMKSVEVHEEQKQPRM
jgi:hypothetical protein